MVQNLLIRDLLMQKCDTSGIQKHQEGSDFIKSAPATSGIISTKECMGSGWGGREINQ